MRLLSAARKIVVLEELQPNERPERRKQIATNALATNDALRQEKELALGIAYAFTDD